MNVKIFGSTPSRIRGSVSNKKIRKTLARKNTSGLSAMEADFARLNWIQRGSGLAQNEHHAFDVYNHTRTFVDFIKQNTRDPTVIVASWLHDISKPEVAKPKVADGKRAKSPAGKLYYEFETHEVEGEKRVRKMNPFLFKKYNLNQEKVAKLVGAHFIPMKGIKALRKTPNFSEFVKSFATLEKTLDATGLARDEIMLMFAADSLSKLADTSPATIAKTDHNELMECMMLDLR